MTLQQIESGFDIDLSQVSVDGSKPYNMTNWTMLHEKRRQKREDSTRTQRGWARSL